MEEPAAGSPEKTKHVTIDAPEFGSAVDSALVAAGKAPIGRQMRRRSTARRMSAVHKAQAKILSKSSRFKQRRQYAKYSLYVLPLESKLRLWIIALVESRVFENVVVALIVANSIFLCLNDPLSDPDSSLNQALEAADLVFTFLFTVEMCLKIAAMGFLDAKHAYLRDPWNIVDFLVVTMGFVALLPGVESVSALRTFRLLRPLRTLTTVAGMRVIVTSLLTSIPALFNVALLCVFIFFFFGIIGVQLWSGVMRGRCFFEDGLTLDESDESGCAMQCDDCPPAYGNDCVDFVNATGSYPRVCLEDMNPNFGYTGFDNIGQACLTIYTSITLEGWVDVLYRLNESFGLEPLNVTYFILLVMFGSFFLLNLALAVMESEYNKVEAAEKANQIAEAARRASELMALPQAEREARMSAARAPRRSSIQIIKDLVMPDEPSKLRQAMGDIAETVWFSNLIIFMIVLNTACLAAERYDNEEATKDFLWAMNLVFTIVFTMEMVFKLVGMGVRKYCSDRFNVFDGVIVVISIVETSVALAASSNGTSGLSALRTFRLMRVFKLARSWKGLRDLLNTISKSVFGVANAGVVLAIVMLIFCLLGMQIFGANMQASKFDGEQPRAHFDSLWWSFVTVFQILTGENWNEVLYNGMHAVGTWTVAYFVVLNVAGNYMMLNLFLAVLLGQFDPDDDEEEEEEEGGEEDASHADAIAPMDAMAEGNEEDEDEDEAEDEDEHEADLEAGGGSSAKVVPISAEAEKYLAEQPTPKAVTAAVHRSLRQLAEAIISHPRFDNAILVLIGVSSVLLALDEPRLTMCAEADQDSGDYHESCVDQVSLLYVLDVIITTLFSLEMVFKVVARGTGYLRDSWNLLDGCIVVISIVSVIFTNQKGLKAVRALRALRALRPLRVVSRYPGMKLVVQTIFRSLPAVSQVALVCSLFFLIFGIVGVQNWSGAMSSCNDGSVELIENCHGSFNVTGSDCFMQPTDDAIYACKRSEWGMPVERRWEPPPANFDHIGNALLTLFEITSGEMWPDIMYVVVDAVGPEEPLERDANRPAALYFVIVQVVCSFLMLNLFVGVIISSFEEMKEENEDQSVLLTEEQRQWVDTMRNMVSLSALSERTPPEDPFRKPIYKVVTSTRFELMIMACIMLNAISMSMTSYGESQEKTDALAAANTFFTVVFALEAAFKLGSMFPKEYFADHWNRFDFVCVLVGMVGLGADVGQFGSLLRVFRVARIFRLVRTSEGLLNLFKTMLFALPSLVNVGAILLLTLFIYAIVGMNLFAYVRHGEHLTEHANFETFLGSLLTLFRMSTGESFNGIMHDCMIEEPYCVLGTNCGYPRFAPLYFVSYFLVTAYCLLNLLVAIILDNFQDTVAASQAAVSEMDMEKFQEVWKRYDPKASHFIPAEDLPKLLLDLEHPLGLVNMPGLPEEPGRRRRYATRVAMEVHIPHRKGDVIHFRETLHHLALRALGNVDVDVTGCEHIVDGLINKQLERDGLDYEHTTTIAQVHATMVIQSAARGYIVRAIRAKKKRMAAEKAAPVTTKVATEEDVLNSALAEEVEAMA